ncbi:13212_t:CDS:1, partial [Cetraspora pellucida]
VEGHKTSMSSSIYLAATHRKYVIYLHGGKVVVLGEQDLQDSSLYRGAMSEYHSDIIGINQGLDSLSVPYSPK